MNGYVSPWGCWKLNLDPLQEQEALLMIDPFLLSSISPPLYLFSLLVYTVLGNSRPKIIFCTILRYFPAVPV